jgi:uncharacterized membrane protein
MSPELVRLLETTTAVIEIMGVSVLVWGFLISVGRYLRDYRRMARPALIREFKRGLGRTILIGLEILVAATILKTVTKEATLVSVGMLAGMVIVRTILNWTIVLEMDGHWPWQSENRPCLIADEVSHTADEIESEK